MLHASIELDDEGGVINKLFSGVILSLDVRLCFRLNKMRDNKNMRVL